MMKSPGHPISGEDSLFRVELTRVLRTQLEDAQILRDTKSDYSKKSCQRLSSFRFITSNILELPTRNIDVAAATDSLDQNRLSIEVIRDPLKCSLNHQRHPIR